MSLRKSNDSGPCLKVRTMKREEHANRQSDSHAPLHFVQTAQKHAGRSKQSRALGREEGLPEIEKPHPELTLCINSASLVAASSPFKTSAREELPLDNLSGDSAQEYFSDGMTEELICAVARVDSLRVISRTSVMRYKGAKNPCLQSPKN